MFGKLDKLIFEGEVPTEQTVPKKAAAAPVPGPASALVPPSITATPTTDQDRVAVFVGIVQDAIEKSLSGTLPLDYYKFRKAVKANEGMIPDERIRFISAFQSAKILSVSKAQLLESANKAMEVVSSEELAFESQVKDKQSVIDGLTKQVADLDEKIATLMLSLDEQKKKKQELVGQKDDEANRLAVALNSHHAATLKVTDDIKNDINKITTYLEQ